MNLSETSSTDLSNRSRWIVLTLAGVLLPFLSLLAQVPPSQTEGSTPAQPNQLLPPAPGDPFDEPMTFEPKPVTLQENPANFYVWSLAFTPDGQTLAAGIGGMGE